MNLRTLALPPSQGTGSLPVRPQLVENRWNISKLHRLRDRASSSTKFTVSAKSSGENDDKEEAKESNKKSLFSSVTEALDFSQVRSSRDAELLDDARQATKSGGRMTKEQYGALRRKIGGTYKDFFKSYIDVDGQYVEEGWVDKTCKVCKKDTRGEARQVDKFGRYVHMSCLENPNSSSGNFFTKLFSK